MSPVRAILDTLPRRDGSPWVFASDKGKLVSLTQPWGVIRTKAGLRRLRVHDQQELFPRLESELGPMGERYELFVAVLELVRVEALLPYFRGRVGRPEEDRAALVRAFIAKAVFDVPTTRALIERLEVDGRLRRLCGWSGGGRLPSEATFSRAFSEFAESQFTSRLHETLIARTMDGHLVGHISRDATAIEAREKPRPKPQAAKPKGRRKRGRPRKGEERAKEASRLERQLTMSLPQMLADLPRACDVGTKRNVKGHTTSWSGYKLHVDTADGGVPISCIMTSASVNDSLDVVEQRQDTVLEQPQEPGPALRKLVHRAPEGGIVASFGCRRPVRVVLAGRGRQLAQVRLHQVVVLAKPLRRHELRERGEAGVRFRGRLRAVELASCRNGLLLLATRARYTGKPEPGTEAPRRDDQAAESLQWRAGSSAASRFGEKQDHGAVHRGANDRRCGSRIVGGAVPPVCRRGHLKSGKARNLDEYRAVGFWMVGQPQRAAFVANG